MEVRLMFKKNHVPSLFLWLVITVQVIFAVVAEYNEEYLKASYELLWAIFLTLFVYEGGKE
jgi:uncharacterized membrane protein YwzB